MGLTTILTADKTPLGLEVSTRKQSVPFIFLTIDDGVGKTYLFNFTYKYLNDQHKYRIIAKSTYKAIYKGQKCLFAGYLYFLKLESN